MHSLYGITSTILSQNWQYGNEFLFNNRVSLAKGNKRKTTVQQWVGGEMIKG